MKPGEDGLSTRVAIYISRGKGGVDGFFGGEVDI